MSWKSSKSESRESLPDSVVVGRIRRPHGVRGEVMAELLSDVPRRLDVGREVSVVTVDGTRHSVRIEKSAARGRTVKLRLAGVDTRDDAEALRDAVLEVPRCLVPPAPEGSYYFFELEGCRCVDSKEGDLGLVDEIVEDGGGLLLRVTSKHRELLVPFVARYLRQVNIEERTIRVELPDGFVEACASQS